MSSVVAFARRFAQLKAELLRDGETDLRLMRLVDFAGDAGDTLHKPAYATYLQEWRSLVEHQLEDEGGLQDLLPDELEYAAEVCDELSDKNVTDTIGLELARKLCYVGEVEKALDWLNHDGNDDSSVASAVSLADTTDEYDAARQVLQALSPDSPLTEQLEKILGHWRLEREALSFDSVKCLFVDKGGHTIAAGRGRMRTLVCKNADTIARQETNEVVFDNQVRSPDDPFVGASYNALDAVGQILLRDENGSNSRCLRVHLGVEGSHQTFTGDSIALAVALVGYAMLMKPQIHRHERFIAGEIAVTGSLTAEGTLMAVNAGSLNKKIERAFFSPVKYVVVPQDNAAMARECIEQLRAKYPRRRLQVIAYERLQDVINDHNVIRPEKVCMGAFVARKARRYTGSIRVQVPLLLGLTWLLLALLSPKYFDPWFDWNPVYAIANPTTNSLEAYNRDSTLLWADVLSCPISKVTSDRIWSTSFGKTYDFDGDGRNEVVFLPRIDEVCDDRAHVRFYASDGQLVWKGNAALLGRYPKDTAGVQYDAGYLRIVETSNGPVIVSIVYQDMPARAHIRLWDAAGDSLGWYVHWGHGAIQEVTDIDHDGQDEILFTGFYNRKQCVALLVLRPDSVQGFSPIEPGIENEYPWWIPGNQVAYILFPKSDVGCLADELPAGYNAPGPSGLRVADDGLIQVNISESVDYEGSPQLIYTIDKRFRVVKVAMTDILVTHRQQLVAEGKLQPIEDASAYFDALRDAVTYWTDSGWVTEGQLRAVEGQE